MRNNFQIWVNAVCEQVRFRPDRKAIAKELRDHYEEHVRDLLRLGRSRELAEQRALEAMGNAQEVGRALDRVHKPWLGWLWEVSRVLLLAAALLLAWKVWENDYYTRSLADRTWDQLIWSAPSAASMPPRTIWTFGWSPGNRRFTWSPMKKLPIPGRPGSRSP